MNNNNNLKKSERTKELIRSFVFEYYSKYGVMPKYKEIIIVTGIGGKTTIWRYMKEIKQEGLDNCKSCTKVDRNISNLNTTKYATKAEYFCVDLKRRGVKRITLLEFSDLYLKTFRRDTKTLITDLYAAAIGAGIEVTDCAWSRD